MMSLAMESSSSSLNQQSKLGTMDDHVDHDDDGHVVLSCSSSDDDGGGSSVVSTDSDLFGEEEGGGGGGGGGEISSSSSSSSSFSPTSLSSAGQQLANGPLQDMSSLLRELPIKKGLSKHYKGKSQSFTSLANVMCLEDLAKPENPYNKKRLKSCKSYGLLESYRSSQPHRSASSSRLISKKATKGSCSSLNIKRNASFLRPPIPPPHRSATTTTSFTNQTPLFA